MLKSLVIASNGSETRELSFSITAWVDARIKLIRLVAGVRAMTRGYPLNGSLSRPRKVDR